jgi:hypothetical protein
MELSTKVLGFLSAFWPQAGRKRKNKAKAFNHRGRRGEGKEKRYSLSRLLGFICDLCGEFFFLTSFAAMVSMMKKKG